MPRALKLTSRRSRPAHRAETRARLSLASVGGILTSTAIIGAGAFVGLASVDGTYALWNDTSNVGAPVVDSGSMKVRVGSSATGPNPSTPYVINTSTLPVMFPGDFQQATFYVDVDNSPANLTSDVYIRTTLPVPSGFEMNVASGTCVGQLSGNIISTTDVFLSNWSAQSTNPICVQISIPLTSPSTAQGTTSGKIEFIITSRQKP